MIGLGVGAPQACRVRVPRPKPMARWGLFQSPAGATTGLADGCGRGFPGQVVLQCRQLSRGGERGGRRWVVRLRFQE